MKRVFDLSAVNTVLNDKQCVKLKYGLRSEDDGSFNGNVTIYRREEKEYIFRGNGKEYFDLMTPTDKDIIFKGNIEPQYSFAEFLDTDIEKNKVYVYWVGRGEAPEKVSAPAPVKTRDPYVFWSLEKIRDRMQMLSEKFPDTEIINVGETVAHKPLDVIISGNRENVIALVGTVHPCESGPEILLTFLENVLENNPELLHKTGIAILPSANADGRDEFVKGTPWSIRTNKNGVDLNRNFDCDWQEVSCYYNLNSSMPQSPTYRGPYPNSEPETRALINMTEIIKPKIVLSYHWLCSVTGDSALSSGKAFKDKNSEYIGRVDKMTRAYSDAFRDCAGEKRIENARTNYGDCTGGSFITWLYSKDIVAVDFEAWTIWNEGILKGAESDLTTREQLDIATKCHTEAIKTLMNM